MAQLISFATSVGIQQRVMHYHPRPVLGYVKDDKYYDIQPQSLLTAGEMAKAIGADALIFSIPSLIAFPDKEMMEIQRKVGIAFGIIGGTDQDATEVFFWGGKTPISPIIGRQFIHGIWDCYSLVKDTFALGKNALREQELTDWPYDSIKLPEVPRDDAWWDKGANLYIDWLKPAGFIEIKKEEARAGDGFLMPIRSTVMNHAGLVVSDNEILHHLPTRLSRRENAGMWRYQAEMWVRYVG